MKKLLLITLCTIFVCCGCGDKTSDNVKTETTIATTKSSETTTYKFDEKLTYKDALAKDDIVVTQNGKHQILKLKKMVTFL